MSCRHEAGATSGAGWQSSARSSSDPECLALRAAQGIFDPEVLRWLQSGFSAYFRAGAGMQMERSFRMLTTPGQRRRRQRNYWLIEAASEMAPDPLIPLPRAMHDAIERFITRGPWRAWRDLADPPAGAARLHVALFRFAQANDGACLSLRRIEQLLPTEIQREKFRPATNRLQPMDSPDPQPLED